MERRRTSLRVLFPALLGLVLFGAGAAEQAFSRLTLSQRYGRWAGPLGQAAAVASTSGDAATRARKALSDVLVLVQSQGETANVTFDQFSRWRDQALASKRAGASGARRKLDTETDASLVQEPGSSSSGLETESACDQKVSLQARSDEAFEGRLQEHVAYLEQRSRNQALLQSARRVLQQVGLPATQATGALAALGNLVTNLAAFQKAADAAETSRSQSFLQERERNGTSGALFQAVLGCESERAALRTQAAEQRRSQAELLATSTSAEVWEALTERLSDVAEVQQTWEAHRSALSKKLGAAIEEGRAVLAEFQEGGKYYNTGASSSSSSNSNNAAAASPPAGATAHAGLLAVGTPTLGKVVVAPPVTSDAAAPSTSKKEAASPVPAAPEKTAPAATSPAAPAVVVLPPKPDASAPPPTAPQAAKPAPAAPAPDAFSSLLDSVDDISPPSDAGAASAASPSSSSPAAPLVHQQSKVSKPKKSPPKPRVAPDVAASLPQLPLAPGVDKADSAPSDAPKPLALGGGGTSSETVYGGGAVDPSLPVGDPRRAGGPISDWKPSPSAAPADDVIPDFGAPLKKPKRKEQQSTASSPMASSSAAPAASTTTTPSGEPAEDEDSLLGELTSLIQRSPGTTTLLSSSSKQQRAPLSTSPLGFMQLDQSQGRKDLLGRHRRGRRHNRRTNTALQQLSVAAALLGGVANEQNSKALTKLAGAVQATATTGGGDLSDARSLLMQTLSKLETIESSDLGQRRKEAVHQRCVEDPTLKFQQVRNATEARKEASSEVERSEAAGSVLLLQLQNMEQSVTSAEEEREDAIEESDRIKAAVGAMQADMKKANGIVKASVTPEVDKILHKEDTAGMNSEGARRLRTAMVQMQDALDGLAEPDPPLQKLLFAALGHLNGAFGEQLRRTVKGVRDLQKEQQMQAAEVAEQKSNLAKSEKALSDLQVVEEPASCDKAVAAEVRSMVSLAAVEGALQLMGGGENPPH